MELTLDVSCYIFIFPSGRVEQSKPDGIEDLYHATLSSTGVKVLRVLKYSGQVEQLTQDPNDDLVYVWSAVNEH